MIIIITLSRFVMTALTLIQILQHLFKPHVLYGSRKKKKVCKKRRKQHDDNDNKLSVPIVTISVLQKQKFPFQNSMNKKQKSVRFLLKSHMEYLNLYTLIKLNSV